MKMLQVTIRTGKFEEELAFYKEIVGLKIVRDLREKGRGIVFLAGMLLRDFDVMFSGILLFFGWLFILIACLTGRSGGNNIFALMSKEQMILLPKDAENLLLVYLIFKAVIIVFSHYLGFPWSIQ